MWPRTKQAEATETRSRLGSTANIASPIPTSLPHSPTFRDHDPQEAKKENAHRCLQEGHCLNISFQGLKLFISFFHIKSFSLNSFSFSLIHCLSL